MFVYELNTTINNINSFLIRDLNKHICRLFKKCLKKFNHDFYN